MDHLIKRLTKDSASTRSRAKGAWWPCCAPGNRTWHADFEEFVSDIPGADRLLAKAPRECALVRSRAASGRLLGGRNGPGRWAGLAHRSPSSA